MSICPLCHGCGAFLAVSSLPFLLASHPCRLPRGGVGSVQCQVAGPWAKCQLPAPSSPPAPIFLPLWLVPLLSSPSSSSQLLSSPPPSWTISSILLPLSSSLLIFPFPPHFSSSPSSVLFFPSISCSLCPSPFLTAPFSLIFSLPSFSLFAHLSLPPPPSFCMSECSHFCMDTGLMLPALALTARNRVWGKETNSQAPCRHAGLCSEGAQRQVWGLSRRQSGAQLLLLCPLLSIALPGDRAPL